MKRPLQYFSRRRLNRLARIGGVYVIVLVSRGRAIDHEHGHERDSRSLAMAENELRCGEQISLKMTNSPLHREHDFPKMLPPFEIALCCTGFGKRKALADSRVELLFLD